MEGRNGQTWGKMALGIKIFDLNEIDNIGYKRAFYRECIPMVLSVLGLLYVLFFGKPNSHEKWGDDDIFSLIQSFWFIAELVTMLFSIKRRAIHDLIAHSVVINISELEREHIQRERIEILETLKATSPT